MFSHLFRPHKTACKATLYELACRVKNEARTLCQIAFFLLSIFFFTAPACMNAAENDQKARPGVKDYRSGHVAPASDAHKVAEAEHGAPEEAAAETETEGKKSPPERLAAQLTAVLKILSICLLLPLLSIVAWIIIRDLRSKTVYLEPIDVPTDLAEKGYTSEVIAQRIVAGIRQLQRARNRIGPDQEFELSSSQEDFTVPSTGLSYRSVIGILRQAFKLREKRVRGELVRDTTQSRDEGRTLQTLEEKEAAAKAAAELSREDIAKRAYEISEERRSTGAGGDETSDWLQAERELHEKIHIVLWTSEVRTTSPPLCVATEPELLEKTVLKISSLVDPNLFATYNLQNDQQKDPSFTKTFEAVQACFEHTPVREHYRAYITWGSALTFQRKYEEAEHKFRSAKRLTPRFAWPFPRRGILELYTSWGILERQRRRFDAAAKLFEKAIFLNEWYVYAWQYLGNVCADRKMFRKAKRWYHRAIQLDRTYAPARAGFGNMSFRLGRYADAPWHFERAIDLDPNFGWSYVNWAHLLRAQRKYEAAIEKVRIAAEETGPHAQSYAVWGQILIEMEKFEEADCILEKSVKADPNVPDGFAMFGLLRNRQKLFEEAIGACQMALEIDPYYAPAYLYCADALHSLGHNNAAIFYYDSLIAWDRYFTSAYTSKGRALRSRGEFSKAISMFKQAVKNDRLDSGTWKAWGDVLLAMHHEKEAIGKFRKAVRINPWNLGAHTSWGRALTEIACYEEAERKFAHAIQEDAKFVPAYTNWASSLRKQGEGKIKDAKEKLRIATEEVLGPAFAKARAYADWGDILRSEGEEKIKDAKEKLRIATEEALGPDEAKAYADWGDILRSEGEENFDEAKKKYEKATDADSNLVDGLLGLGRLELKQAKNEEEKREAMRRYERAKEIDPYSTTVQCDWAEALSKRGIKAKAIRKLRTAMSMNPYDARAYRQLAQILLERKWQDKAIRILKRGRKFNPCNARLQEDLDQARALIRKLRAAIRENRCDAKAYRQLAQIFWEKKWHHKAVRILKRGQKFNPCDANLQEELDRVRAQIRRPARLAWPIRASRALGKERT
jgi:tetratricopeptide (TPR) repeat protein